MKLLLTREQKYCDLQVLSDDEKKSLYDRFGEAGVKGAGGMGGMGVRFSKHILLGLFKPVL